MKEKESLFFKAARMGFNDWWIYLTTALLIIIGYVLGQIPLTLVLLGRMNQDQGIDTEALEQFNREMDFSIFSIDKNLGLVLMITMFGFSILGLWAGMRLHKRSFQTLINPYKTVRWKRLLFAFGVWFALSAGFELLQYAQHPEAYTFSFDPISFLILLLICLILLPIQTSCEELVFRGYALQGLGMVFKNKWMPLLITTALFALIHSMNPEIDRYGVFPMMTYYIMAGLLLGIVTIMDDGLELALGIHAATNIYGASMVTYEGSVLQTDSLFSTNAVDPWVLNFIFLLCSLFILYVFSKKYKWEKFSYIFKPLNDTPNPESATIVTPHNQSVPDAGTDYDKLLNDKLDE